MDDTPIIINEDQKKAINYNKRPLLIIAGAGTGKTLTIVEKIKYIIKNKLASPEEILALTFTEKAAEEMEERVDRALPYGYLQMWILTFHAFSDQILRNEINHIGLSTNYRLLNQAESIIFLKKNLFLLNLKYFRPLGNPNKFLDALLLHFNRLKDEDISPKDYLNWIKKQQKKGNLIDEEKEKYYELATAYDMFQRIKIKENLFDFSDLIFYLLKLFRMRKNILRNYQKRFKYILIDEFQDTNIAQYLLIKLLCPFNEKPKLTIVGDDSQAIYKFRGASVSNILAFIKDYPTAKVITLKKNYRSNQNILNAAYKLIKNNDPDTLESKLGISKNLISLKKQPIDYQSVEFYIAKKVEEEADFVSNQILKFSPKYRYSDFALLVRANNHADPFITSFYRHGIPYQFLGPGMLFKQSEVKDLIAYLFFLSDVEDSVSLYRVLSMEIFDLDRKDVSFLLAFSKKISLSLFQSIIIYLSFFSQELYQKDFDNYKNYLPLLTKKTRITLQNIEKIINRHLDLLKKETAGQILYYFMENTGYLNRLISYKNEKGEKIALNVSKFFEKLKSYEIQHEDSSVFAIVDYLKMSLELGESPSVSETDLVTYDAVNILTVHSAKGLEFPIVFIVNLANGRFPTFERKELIPIPDDLIKETLPLGDYHIEEERRLFYVALTRSMDKVFLSTSQFYGEGKRERKISSFIKETLNEKQINKIQSIKKEEKKQLSIFDYKKIESKIIKNKLLIKNFSFSQLETFITCPLQYKYQFILKIPTISSSAATFGETIHKTLQNFYQNYLQNKNLNFLNMIESYLKNWIPIGYTTKKHQEIMKEEGKKMLKKFYEKFHSKKISIIELEKFFKIKINKNIFITGKIDRIDFLKGGQIEIIDYKTGRKPDEKELKNSLQLSIYALAAIDKGIFNKKIDQIILTFYYLKDTQKISTKRGQKDINQVKNQIVEIAEKINNSDFHPNVGRWCDFCLFKMACEAWQ